VVVWRRWKESRREGWRGREGVYVCVKGGGGREREREDEWEGEEEVPTPEAGD